MSPKINKVIKEFFESNPQISKIRAKDLMPQFIKAGIFNKDHRNGLPIRDVLRNLDENNQFDKSPMFFLKEKLKTLIGFS